MQRDEFENVYQRHAAAVLGYARRCVGRADIAEELASDAFCELLRHAERIEAGQLPAWLFTVVRNRAIDYWRKHRLETEYVEGRDEPPPATPQRDWGVLESVDLNASHRLCLTLRYVHGMSREEIAGFTGLRETQVKGFLRYGLELLRKAFADQPGRGPAAGEAGTK